MLIDIDKLENVQEDGTKITAGCPACLEEGRDHSKNHLTIYKSNGAFSCVIHPRDKDHNKEILKLVGLDNIEYRPDVKKQIEPYIPMPKIFDKEFLVKLLPETSYWNNRGISTDTLKLFGGGLAHEGKMLRRYVIPIYDEKSNIVGFSGRLVVAPRENVPPHKHIGTKSQWVFPLHLNKTCLQETKSVILVESIGCVLSLFECGIKNTLCLWGIKLSKHIIKTLIALDVKKIIIATNNETSEIGNTAAKEIYSDLSKYFDKSQLEIRLPLKKDINEMLVFLGKESIKQLYETR